VLPSSEHSLIGQFQQFYVFMKHQLIKLCQNLKLCCQRNFYSDGANSINIVKTFSRAFLRTISWRFRFISENGYLFPSQRILAEDAHSHSFFSQYDIILNQVNGEKLQTMNDQLSAYDTKFELKR
jgi:hypothetical protein